MKLIFDYKFRFYLSKMNEICLHCHQLYLSLIIFMGFGQCALRAYCPDVYTVLSNQKKPTTINCCRRTTGLGTSWITFGKFCSMFSSLHIFCILKYLQKESFIRTLVVFRIRSLAGLSQALEKDKIVDITLLFYNF